jgi:hypothetical protein
VIKGTRRRMRHKRSRRRRRSNGGRRRIRIARVSLRQWIEGVIRCIVRCEGYKRANKKEVKNNKREERKGQEYGNYTQTR